MGNVGRLAEQTRPNHGSCNNLSIYPSWLYISLTDIVVDRRSGNGKGSLCKLWLILGWVGSGGSCNGRDRIVVHFLSQLYGMQLKVVFYFLIGCIIFISSGRHNIIYWLSGLVCDRFSFVCSCGEQANNKLEQDEEQGGLMWSYIGAPVVLF